MLPEYLNAEGGVNWLKVLPLQLPFKTLLETRVFHENQGTGPYEPLQDGDPLTYVASFVDNPLTMILPAGSTELHLCVAESGFLYAQGTGLNDDRQRF